MSHSRTMLSRGKTSCSRMWGSYTSALERARIGERNQGGQHARITSCKPNASGRPPYGYVWTGADVKKGGRSRLALDPKTAPVVRDMFDLTLAGVPLHGIASALSERGILTLFGGTRWSASTVREILSKHIYTGTALTFQHRYDRLTGGRYKRRPARTEEQSALPDVAPAIVTEEEQAAVLARLQPTGPRACAGTPTRKRHCSGPGMCSVGTAVFP
jgi:hypothetical protein